MSVRVINPNQLKPLYESGFGSARVTPSGYVSNVRIRQDVQGKGYGTALMQQVTSDADRLGKSLTMHARPELHGWYGRLGFQHTGYDVIGGNRLPRLERRPEIVGE